MRDHVQSRLPYLMLPVLLIFFAAGCGGGQKPPVDETNVSPAHVEHVRMIERSDGWEVEVTVLHEDSGWEHYADWWRIVSPEGNELARRVLRHPHVDEQPFTRSLMNVSIAPDLMQLVVEAHCSVHGTGGRTVTLDRTIPQGHGFTVKRPVREN